MEVASRLRSLMFSLIRTPIIITATMWTWAMVIPRALIHYTLCLIELFENTMMTIVWEYQGDNLLKFLLANNHLPPLSPQKPAKQTRSQAVQTTDSDPHDLARTARQRRDILMTQVLEDLVPALLHALHAMPQRGELERMSREQTQWAEIIASQQRQLMDAASHDGHSVDAYAEIARTLQVLVARIGSVDERLIRALNASSFVETQVEEQLGNLYDGLGRVARGCEVEKSTVTELVARLGQLDSVLAAIAASPRTLPGKADSAVIHNATVAAVDTVDTADTTDIVDTVDLSSGGDDDGSESVGSASKIMDSGRASVEGKHIDQFASFRSWKSMKSLASSNSSLDLMKLVLGEPATADPEPSTAASVAPLSVHDVADRSSVFTKQSVERFPDIPTDIVSPQTLDPTPLQSEGTADEVPSTKYDVLPVRQSVDVPRSHSPEEAVAQRRRTVSAVVHSAPAATSSSTKLDKAAAARPATTRSRKFSFREELRRHAWFGKKKH